MGTSFVISTFLFALSIQMTVFMWMWVFATDSDKSVAQLYVGSWKKLGGAIGWFFEPFFRKSK